MIDPLVVFIRQLRAWLDSLLVDQPDPPRKPGPLQFGVVSPKDDPSSPTVR